MAKCGWSTKECSRGETAYETATATKAGLGWPPGLAGPEPSSDAPVVSNGTGSCQAPATRNSFTQAVRLPFPDLLSVLFHLSFFFLFFFRKTNGKSMSCKYSKRKTQEQYKTKQPSKKLKHIQILAEEAQQNYHRKKHNTGKP